MPDNPNVNDVQTALKELRETVEKGAKMTADDHTKVAKLEEVLDSYETKNQDMLTKVKAAENEALDLKERLESLEKEASRPNAPVGTPEEQRQKAVRDNLNLVTKGITSEHRRNPELLTPDEQKALATLRDTDGGYLVDETLTREITRDITEISPVRSVARVITIPTKATSIPKRVGLVTSYWTDEEQSSTNSNSTYGKDRIEANKITTEVTVSNELLDDAAFDMENLIRMDAVESQAQLEGAAFVGGETPNRPEGFMTAQAGITEVNSGVAADFTVDSIIDLIAGIKSGYGTNAILGMNRSTIAAARKKKSGDGMYLWQNGDVQAGIPNSMLGVPVVEMVDLDDVAANAHPIAYGDFRRGYTIVDRLGFAVLRDPYTQAGSDQVKLYFRRRVGGAVINANALAKLKIAV